MSLNTSERTDWGSALKIKARVFYAQYDGLYIYADFRLFVQLDMHWKVKSQLCIVSKLCDTENVRTIDSVPKIVLNAFNYGLFINIDHYVVNVTWLEYYIYNYFFINN